MSRRPEHPVRVRTATVEGDVVGTVVARGAAEVRQGVSRGVAIGIVGTALGFAAAEGVSGTGVGFGEGPAAVEGVFARAEGVEVHGRARDGIEFGRWAGGGAIG